MHRASSVLLFLFALLFICGCTTRPMMPTPNLYKFTDEPLFGDLAPALQTTDVDLFYVTDREPFPDERGRLHYSYGRSRSAAFGSARVEVRGAESWDELEALSAASTRSRLTLHMAEVEELGRFPPTPFPLGYDGGRLSVDPGAKATVSKMVEAFRLELDRRLRLSGRNEVLVYVHGYNNSFEDAAFTIAELWHFGGREGVPILYSWPAGRGGLKGYGYDRESGEFTVYHLKQLLRVLGANPAVERVHVLAHSRGSDVIATALRELFIETWAAGMDPREKLKIENLVLAAADIDGKVLGQRLVAENIDMAIGRTTIYSSESDTAIAAAETLFSSSLRLGRITTRNMPPEARAFLEVTNNVNFVESRSERTGPFGHSYFTSSPGTSSDVILIMRYGQPPGADHGRPLEPLGPGLWAIDDNYLR